ncbi:MAG TPA: hypothetical protein VGN81_11970 [Pseudonocardiaceae bacterium]|jgi:hypothetical protein
MSSTVDDLAADYLRRLEAALKGLPVARRRQLVAEIAEHLDEARTQLAPDDEVGMRELLDRIGRPEDIAAEAVAGEPRTRGWGRGRITLVGAAAAVLVASLVTALVMVRPGHPTVVAAQAPTPPSASASHPAPSTPPVTAPATTTPPPLTTPPVTTTQPAPPQAPALAVRTSAKPPIRSGIYVNGVQGTPHYFVSLASTSSGAVSGEVDFLFQDGQTGVAFTFTGTMRNGVMTIYPANVQNDPRIVNNVPSVLSAEADQDAFGLGECTGYLPGTESLADCSFSYSPEGIDGPPGN